MDDEFIIEDEEMMIFEKNSIELKLEICDVNKMIVQCSKNDNQGAKYGYYIYRNDEIIIRYPYSSSQKVCFWLSESGDYYVKVFVKNQDGKIISKKTETIKFDAENIFDFDAVQCKEDSLWNQISSVSCEILESFPLIIRMARFDYKLENKDAYLGKLWSVLTPLIQIGTYWLVFGLGLRSGKDVDGFPYLIWMLCGLVPWFFINNGIVKGANAIYAKTSLITKMKFPVAAIPISKVLQEFLDFMMMLVITLTILFINGLFPDLYWLNAIYYFLYSVCFLIGMALVTSVMTMVARDSYKLLTSLMKLIFYLTPILWRMDQMPDIYQIVMEYNPIYYIVKGFRESILYHVHFWSHPDMMIVMWIINIVLYVTGCSLQSKFRMKFIDLM